MQDFSNPPQSFFLETGDYGRGVAFDFQCWGTHTDAAENVQRQGKKSRVCGFIELFEMVGVGVVVVVLGDFVCVWRGGGGGGGGGGY